LPLAKQSTLSLTDHLRDARIQGAITTDKHIAINKGGFKTVGAPEEKHKQSRFSGFRSDPSCDDIRRTRRFQGFAA
jgi:hypothetical protein